jgi:organic radical activating enzyme
MMSCCSAAATKINLDWLKQNSGQLFNNPDLIRERNQMLQNWPVASCEDTCWKAERSGLPSRRTLSGSDKETHMDTKANPEVLHITLGSDCNLTCSYCCKQYSTSWIRDIATHGPYLPDERFTINNNDKLVLQLGQKAIKESDTYKFIMSELKYFKGVKRIEITGGEPFLYNGLVDLVVEFTNIYNASVDIFTGLGVNNQRLANILRKLPSSTTFTVSAENTGKFYEFNRYGNTWDNFRKNLDLIQQFDYKFCTVISNLTIHDYYNFKKMLGTPKDIKNICTDPEYLSPNVLDPVSKNNIYADTEINLAIQAQVDPHTRSKAGIYIKEFANRRNLDLTIFPDNFVNWLNG